MYTYIQLCCGDVSVAAVTANGGRFGAQSAPSGNTTPHIKSHTKDTLFAIGTALVCTCCGVCIASVRLSRVTFSRGSSTHTHTRTSHTHTGTPTTIAVANEIAPKVRLVIVGGVHPSLSLYSLPIVRVCVRVHRGNIFLTNIFFLWCVWCVCVANVLVQLESSPAFANGAQHLPQESRQ